MKRALCVAAAAAAFLAAAPQARAQDAAAGKAKAGVCQTCHGLDGRSQIPNAPHIAGHPEMYIAAQLEAYRSGARQNEMMAVIAKNLSDVDIADLAAWYSSIEIETTMPE